jgi:hypothetical protein
MRCRKKAIKMALHLSVLNKWRGPKEMTALRNFESLANTMKGWSTSAGDHHWQAGCAIEQLIAENNFGKKTNAACCVIGVAAIINNAQGR